MRTLVLTIWNLIYPVVAILAAPFWILKMLRRDGWGTGLLERIGFYDRDPEFERSGGVYVHAVSVGEVLLALKVIEKWQSLTDDHFILVPTTATGMAVARERAGDGIRIIYAPLDFGFLIRRAMTRFSPRAVIMVESELWPHLLHQTSRLGIPLGLVNARLSPRSGRRLTKFRGFVAPFLGLFDHVGVPEKEDLARWQLLGVQPEATVLTGNVKFDPSGAALPQPRPEFTQMLAAFPDRPVAMAVSTFSGEEEYLAEAMQEAGTLAVIVPRHAERREDVVKALQGHAVLRSQWRPPNEGDVFVIDSTGELRDWTAHANVVVIGKSFLEKGGQNPSEAILAGVPVICGPHMANFEPLVSELEAAGGIRIVRTRDQLMEALRSLPKNHDAQVAAARCVLGKHEGAMIRTIEMFTQD